MSAKIKIDLVEYEMPESLTLGEAVIVERYCEGHMSADKSYSLGKLMGMIHVAVRRVRPELPFDEIRKRLEALDLDELPGDDDDSPPSQSETEESGSTLSADSETPSVVFQESASPESSGSPPSDNSRSVPEISKT